MNRTQLEYAIHRLKDASTEKLSALKDRYTKKHPPFDAEALVKAIKEGKVTAKKNIRAIHRYDDVGVVFVGIDKFLRDNDDDVYTDKDAYEKEASAIRADVIKITDQLYLGDAKEALALIEAFAAKKF